MLASSVAISVSTRNSCLGAGAATDAVAALAAACVNAALSAGEAAASLPGAGRATGVICSVAN